MLEAAHKCQMEGCPSAYGIECAYVDRKDRPCKTYWCQEHVVEVDGNPYCRRHAPVVAALKESHFAQHFPDIDNRGPSLANWMGNALNEGVRQILGTVVDPAQGENLVTEELTYYFLLPQKEHRWERAWKIVSHSGVKLKVSVQVDEKNDALVRIDVAGGQLMRLVPPWVVRNRERRTVDAEVDRIERTEFYEEILREISRAVGVTQSSASSPS